MRGDDDFLLLFDRGEDCRDKVGEALAHAGAGLDDDVVRTFDGPGHRLGHLQLLVPDLVPRQPASHCAARSKDRGRVQLRHAVSPEGKRNRLQARSVSTHHSLSGAGGGGVELSRDAPSPRGQPSGLHRQPHGAGHAQRIGCAGDSGVEQDAVAAQLHGDHDIAGRADTRVHDHGIEWIVGLEVLEDDPDVVGVQDPLTAADRAAGRHDRRGPGLLEPAGHHRVVAGVAKDLEAFGNQDASRLERGDRVGQERPGVCQDFELDPVGAGIAQALQQLAAQPGGPQGLLGREAAGGIGQDRVPLRIEIIKQVPSLAVEQPLPADRDGDHLGTTGRQAVAHQLQRRVLSGADEEPAVDVVRSRSEAAGPRPPRTIRTAADERDDLQRVARRKRGSLRAGPAKRGRD